MLCHRRAGGEKKEHPEQATDEAQHLTLYEINKLLARTGREFDQPSGGGRMIGVVLQSKKIARRRKTNVIAIAEMAAGTMAAWK